MQNLCKRQLVPCCCVCRSSEAVLTRQAAALVRGVNLVAGLRNRLQLLLDLHAAAGLPVTQQALSLFVTSISLVKVRLTTAKGKLRLTMSFFLITLDSVVFSFFPEADDCAVKANKLHAVC